MSVQGRSGPFLSLIHISFIRGIFIFGGSIKNGTKQIMFSANEAEVEEGEPTKFDKWVERKIGMEKAEKILMSIACLLYTSRCV